MRVRHLFLLVGLFVSPVAHGSSIRADYTAVSSLRHHLPINIPEARDLGPQEIQTLECLAWNVYFEARGGEYQEQVAVAWVPINRTNHAAFSRDICTNVFQYGWAGGRRQYQFSWAGIVRGPRWRREDETWIRMQRIALSVYMGQQADPARGALYFHHARLASWAPRATKIRLGSHVFWGI